MYIAVECLFVSVVSLCPLEPRHLADIDSLQILKNNNNRLYVQAASQSEEQTKSECENTPE